MSRPLPPTPGSRSVRSGTLGPQKLGDLEFLGVEGDTLELVVADVVRSNVTRGNVAPGTVITLPEPGIGAALALGVVGLWLLSRTRRPRAVSAAR